MASELSTLIDLSRSLGEPNRDLVILAEGNTSIRTDPDRMLVKASGSQLRMATSEDFVEVDTRALVNLLDEGHTDDDVEQTFAKVSGGGKRPSVEAIMHALCLSLGQATVVGHTHPVPLNVVLCSTQAEIMASAVLFPEQVVILGRRPIFVPYLDPGLTLARAVQTEMMRHLETFGQAPKVIYLGNHGLFALGGTADEVLQITEMAVKVSRIVGGALAFGELLTLSPAAIERIDTRPDEDYRRRRLAAGQQRSTRDGGTIHD